MTRFLTITLNAAIDITYHLSTLKRGAVNRSLKTVAVAGGKGNNVARVLRSLGHHVIASGFLAGQAGDFINQGLTREGIETSFLRVPGESRRCLTFIEHDPPACSELLEQGPMIPAEVAAAFLVHAAALAATVSVVVISGSLPPGVAPDFYAHLIRAVKAAPVTVVLDTSGEALRLGVEAAPDLVKPNQVELLDLVGHAGTFMEQVQHVQRRILGSVLDTSAQVLVSMDGDGAALVTREHVIEARAARVTVVNPVGAGDALLAGYLHARSEGANDEGALARAVATGSAATLQDVAGVVDRADVERLLRETRSSRHAPHHDHSLGSREER